jgi:rRNA maturation endonuclease Nob1
MDSYSPCNKKRKYNAQKRMGIHSSVTGLTIGELIERGYKYYCRYCEEAYAELGDGHCPNCRERWNRTNKLRDLKSGEEVS